MTGGAMRAAVAGLAVLVTACGRGTVPASDKVAAPVAMATATPTPAAAPTPVPSYLGRWTGVEGMVLDVAAGEAPDRFRLTMQYDLDHRQTTDARLVGERLLFTRDGEARALRPTDGKATGLKYLAGKTHCLTVASGEGYCRD